MVQCGLETTRGRNTPYAGITRIKFKVT